MKIQEPEHEIKLSSIINYEGQPSIKTEVVTNAVTLDEIFPIVEGFLRGMGFQINGEIGIIDEED